MEPPTDLQPKIAKWLSASNHLHLQPKILAIYGTPTHLQPMISALAPPVASSTSRSVAVPARSAASGFR